MIMSNETPPLGAAGLGDDAFLSGNSNFDITPKPANEAIAALRQEFIADCLHTVLVKAANGADNMLLGDTLTARRDIEIAIAHLREVARSFRELAGSP